MCLILAEAEIKNSCYSIDQDSAELRVEYLIKNKINKFHGIHINITNLKKINLT